MTNENEQRIRELAHHIWESEGCPQGEEARHWHMAKRLIEAGEAAQTTEPAPLPKLPRRTVAVRSGNTTAPARTVRRKPSPKGTTP